VGSKTCNISETVQDRTKFTMTDQQDVAYTLSIGTKINDLRWPGTAKTHSCGKKIILRSPR